MTVPVMSMCMAAVLGRRVDPVWAARWDDPSCRCLRLDDGRVHEAGEVRR